MRKIASNYIFLPDFPLTKNGYVVIESNTYRVVDTGGIIKEIEGLEFYGGMLVAMCRNDNYQWCVGDDILKRLSDCYLSDTFELDRFVVIVGADLVNFKWCSDTVCVPLR